MEEDPSLQTIVNEDYTIEIPKPLRNELDLEPGDTLRWDVTDSGRLIIEQIDE